MNTTLRVSPQGIDHYENFPVASWLCPPRLRPPITAIYGFARTADDLADEGTASAEQRLAALAEFRAELEACVSRRPDNGRWPGVFVPLGAAIRDFALPPGLLADLLSAFEQDAIHSRDGTVYASRTQLLDYCRRSANPIGRLLLHLYGIDDPNARRESDAVCTALQLINFWQDAGVDLARGRYYLVAEDLRRHGLDPTQPSAWSKHPGAPGLITECANWARDLMQAGSGIVHRVPGRAGWELRLVVQGGLRVLELIEEIGFDTFARRPALHGRDLPLMLWRAWRM